MSLVISKRVFRVILGCAMTLGFLAVAGTAQVIHQTFPVNWTPGQLGDGSYANWQYLPYTTFSSSLGELQKVEIWISLTATGLTPGDNLRIVTSFFTGWSPAAYQDNRDQTMSCPGETLAVSQTITITDPAALQSWVDPLYGPGGHQYTVTQTFQGGHTISGTIELVYYYGLQSLEVTCDVMPGSLANVINLKSNGVIPVAILSTSAAKGEGIDFDALSVDPATVTFGPGRAAECHGKGHVEDVDGDGDLDLVFHFRTADAGLTPDDSLVEIRGKTIDGMEIFGHDRVICKK